MKPLERQLKTFKKTLTLKTITWSIALTCDQNVHLGDISQDLYKRETIND